MSLCSIYGNCTATPEVQWKTEDAEEARLWPGKRPPEPERALVATSATSQASIPSLPTIEEEREVVTNLITQGWEQGCWVPDRIARHFLSAASQRAWLEVCGNRSRVHLEQELSDQGLPVPETIPQDTQCPDDTIWIVVSQRCDIIKGLRDEPIVSLIRATKWAALDARKITRRSANLSIARMQGDDAWVADFREAITIPKTALAAHTARQCMPTDESFRREFALKYAQRMWRRPVPRDIQTRIEKPLEDKRQSGEWKRFFAVVAEFLVVRDADSQRLRLIAILGDPIEYEEETHLAKFFGDRVLPHLNPDQDSWLDHEGSEIRPAEEVSIHLAFRSYKLNLDHLSSGTDAAGPHF